jgi:hypothetical protein
MTTLDEHIHKLAKTVNCGTYNKSNGVFVIPHNLVAFYLLVRKESLYDAADDFETGLSADDIRCNANRI